LGEKKTIQLADPRRLNVSGEDSKKKAATGVTSMNDKAVICIEKDGRSLNQGLLRQHGGGETEKKE